MFAVAATMESRAWTQQSLETFKLAIELESTRQSNLIRVYFITNARLNYNLQSNQCHRPQYVTKHQAKPI